VCNEPIDIELETTKTNEDGKLVHEECYMGSAAKPTVPAAKSPASAPRASALHPSKL
jgi:hypothetical protein